MNDQLASVLFWLVILIPLGVFARQIQQVRRGGRRNVVGIGLAEVLLLTVIFAIALWFLRAPGDAA